MHLTIRAVTRQHRFAPEDGVIESIRFIFWQCVAHYGVVVHDTLWMSNHAHIVLTDVEGMFPKFVGKMNSLISRQLNSIRGIQGTNFEKRYADIEVIGDEAMIRTCAYTLANPCAAHLVDSAGDWEGMSTLDLEYGKKFDVLRPNCGLWKQPDPADAALEEENSEQEPSARPRKKPSLLPEKVRAVLTRPKVCPHLSDRELRAEIRIRTKALEDQAAQQREKAGTEVVGWEKVSKIPWNSVATSFESIGKQQPKASVSCESERKNFENRIASFRQRYQQELNIYRFSDPNLAVFPMESWKMPVIYNAYYDPFPT